MTKHALRACGRSPCAARRLPRAPQPARPHRLHPLLFAGRQHRRRSKPRPSACPATARHPPVYPIGKAV